MKTALKCTTWVLSTIVLVSVLVSFSPALRNPVSVHSPQDAATVVRQMISKAKSIGTLKYRQMKWERINGILIQESLNVKLVRSPFKVYIKQTSPRQAEVLYVTGWNGGKAYVNAGSWLPNLSLDINGSQLRENQHHNLLSSGFDVLATIFEHLLNKYSANPSMAKLEASESLNGRNCHKVVLDNPNFGFVNYTVLQGENLISIARKLKLCEHMILENNTGIDDYSDVSAGQVIKVPTDFAKKAIIWIYQATLLPLKVMVFDHKGLYERYEYLDVSINPTFQSNEFTTDFPEYGF